ncbi:MAG TPA: type II toxin-antitoxin system RatA family toxin [Aestuariivirgaceae bacterium]|jgi:coenzyme Q-binding protein COQ10
MTVARLNRWFPFEPQQLFPIVSRVEDYCEFLPLCSRSRVWDRMIGADAVERFQAELTIVYPKLALRETFISSVTADYYSLTVAATSRDRPFQHLECTWVLHPARGGTNIEMALDYAMASRTLQLLLTGLFDYTMRKVMAAFEQRARNVLGPVGAH